MRFDHVAIIGVGLIGGSFALSVRKAGFARKITGWDTPEALEKAISSGVIDHAERSFRAGVECGADLVYLAAPIRGIADFLRTFGERIRADALVTDAGSTKREICAAAREGLRNPERFVGGHPIAGSHHRGVDSADADLFRGAPYAIIADANPSGLFIVTEAARELVDLVKAIGARPVFVTAAEHDHVAARMSHAVQVVSTALAAAAANSGDPNRSARMAGSGFVDMTRLALSSWPVWDDIFRTNADEIAAALREVVVEVDRIREAIESGDSATVARAFRTASEFAASVASGTRSFES